MNLNRATKVVFWLMVAIAVITVVKSAKASNMRTWPECTQIDEDRMLRSIAATENSGWKVGAKGEQGPYQISPKTWSDYSTLPIDQAPHQFHDVVAKNILRHYAALLQKRGQNVTPYNLALVWCSGPYRKVHSKRAKSYAERLNNLYVNEEPKHY